MLRVEMPEQQERRAIIVDEHRENVLLVRTERRLAFPVLRIPCHQRVAENLTRQLEQNFGCCAVSLFALEDHLSTEYGYDVLECCAFEPQTPELGWKAVSSLSEGLFFEPGDCIALRRAIAECQRYAADLHSPFCKPGWPRELSAWAAAAIRPLGLELHKSLCQLNASPSFSLIRFSTNGPDVWFKAVGEPNRHEFGITQTLAKVLPDFLPEIIASRADWNGWLSLQCNGTGLSEIRDVCAWQSAAQDLARLQIESSHKLDDVRRSGARDLSGIALSDMRQPFFETIRKLMRMQTTIPPHPLSDAELDHLDQCIEKCIVSCQELQIPDALGHFDLNPGNIIFWPDGCKFLDWADAYVGNPFFTFQYLLEFLRSTFAMDPTIETRFTTAYLEQWGRLTSGVIDEIRRLSPLLTVFAYAAGTTAWRSNEALRNPKSAGYLRSLTRRMAAEANRLTQRRNLCLCS